MKLNKLAIALVLVFLLSSCMQQASPSSSNAAATETSSIAEQSSSSEVSGISEESTDSYETSELSEISMSELEAEFAEATGDSHPIVKRVVGGHEKYYISYDETDVLTETYFHSLAVTKGHPDLFGIRIQTAKGYIYFNRNATAEIETEGGSIEYELIPFLGGNLDDSPNGSDYFGHYLIYAIGGAVWFHQDEDSITFISVYVDPEHETGSTDIARFDLESMQFKNRTATDGFARNCLLDGKMLYVLCDVGQIPMFYAYAFSWEDLLVLKQSERLQYRGGSADIQLTVRDGMLCGSYESDGEETIMEIMETID